MINELVVLVPSKGRPESATRLQKAFDDTCIARTKLVFIIDETDPRYWDYQGNIMQVNPGRPGMVHPLNIGAAFFAEEVRFIGFMGDDHIPRTRGWDDQIVAALWDLRTGFAYGNDLLQGENLPTACFMTTDIIRALGYMSPPELQHLYVDNFWRDMGRAMGRIKYLPNTVIEHLHFSNGKSEQDGTYIQANSVGDRDQAAYSFYMMTRFDEDLAKITSIYQS